jgi:iron complex outermembrane receptor protein
VRKGRGDAQREFVHAFRRPARFAAVLLTGAGIASLATAAEAQQGATSGRGDPMATVGEVVVTARRRSEAISEVPIAITAFTGDQLRERSIVTLVDLVKTTPGMNINQTASFSPGITIRGQSRGLSGPGTPGVLTYFNDIPLDVLNGLIPTYDMESVQVLKGPQGTLFGRNTIGGAVLTYSRKPTYEFGGHLEAEYGNYDQVRLEGVVNVPIIADKLALRLAAAYSDNDGYTKTFTYSPPVFGPNLLVTAGPRQIPTKRNFDEITTKAFRVSLLWEPTDEIHNFTVFGYRKAEGLNNATFSAIYPNGYAGNSPALYYLPPSVIAQLPLGGLQGAVAFNYAQLFNCPVSTFEQPCNIRQFAATMAPDGRHIAYASIPIDDSQARATTLSNTFTVELTDNLTLKHIFGWQQTKLIQRVELDGTPFSITETDGLSKLDTWSNELQLQGSALDNKLTFVAGGFHYKTVPKDPGGFLSSGVSALAGLSRSYAISYFSSLSKALFAQADYDLGGVLDGLSVTAGYRYTWDQASGCTISAGFLPFVGWGPFGSTLSPFPTKDQCRTNTLPRLATSTTIRTDNFVVPSEKGTYTLALSWRITPDNLVYATTRRGYRSGGFNQPGFSGPNAVGVNVDALQSFDPEVLSDIEIGTKNTFRVGGMPASFELAAYRILTKRTQQFMTTSNVPVLPATGIIVNYADLKFTGFEAAVTISPAEGLIVGANMAYIDPKVRQLNLPPALEQIFALGTPPRQAPPYIFNNVVKRQYNAFVTYKAPSDVLGGRVEFNADFHKQSRGHQSDLVVPGYETVDLRVTVRGLAGRPVDVSAYVRNVFDEYYYGGVQSASLAGTGLASYYVAPPRTYGVSLRYRFGAE